MKGAKEMRVSSAGVLLVPFAVALSLTPASAAAGEKCEKVWIHFGAGAFYDVCPYAYEGPAAPEGPLACYEAPIVGTLSGTSLYYVPPDNCEVIFPADKAGAVWREGKELWACWGLGVFKTRHGTIFTEAAEQTHSDTFSMSSVAFTDFGMVIGGTGRYAGATGWIASFGNGQGGTGGGEVCTPKSAKPKKAPGRR
jgi:hypothetical protein